MNYHFRKKTSKPFTPNQTCDNYGHVSMETNARDILGVSHQRLYTRLVLIIPDLSHKIVGTGDEVRLVGSSVVVQTVDPFLVSH